jgi:predicted phosphodiesterase
MMRIAIVSDIHGNRTAFEAVLADLRQTSPDLIFHGGDLSDAGSSPVEIVDRIRDLGWPGVVGNTDEMLFDPQSLTDFASKLPKLESMFAVIGEMAAFTRQALGEERIAWLRDLPRVQIHGPIALVHASPESAWRSPAPESSDAEFNTVYTPLGKPTVVYGHIHRPFIRRIVCAAVSDQSASDPSVSDHADSHHAASDHPGSGHGLPEMTVINTGSVSLSYDGDRRASYLLLDDFVPSICRVDYDLDQEIKALAACGLPHSDWIVRTLQTAGPQMP